jgi:acetyl esterase/lipase
MVPVCDNTATAESETWSQRPYAPLLIPQRMTLFQEWYLGPRDSPAWAGEHWTASPVRAPQGLLRKCPRTMIIAAGQDLLYPESLWFARRLEEEEVKVNLRIYDEASHVSMAMDKYLDSGRKAIRDVVEFVKEVLVEYEHSLDIKPGDVKNERDCQNLSE